MAHNRGEYWALKVTRVPETTRRPNGRVYQVQVGCAFQHLNADELRELRAQINAALLADEPEDAKR